MEQRNRQRHALSLELPSHCPNSSAATQKWLLALWQGSRTRIWARWRRHAEISFEYVSIAGATELRVYLHSPLHAAATRTLLASHFPGIELSSPRSDPTEQLEPAGVSSEFHLRSPGWVDLPREAEPDGVLGLLGALGALGRNEAAIIQLLLQPTWIATDDGRRPAFWFTGRLATTTSHPGAARSRSALLASTFGQFAGLNSFVFGRPRPLGRAARRSVSERRWPRALYPLARPATPSQIAMLFHPPEHASAAPRLRSIPCVRTATPDSKGTVDLGTGRDERGSTRAVRLRPQDLLRHALVVGPSGTGKTTFLAHLARELIRTGNGVTVLDPHGTLVRSIAQTMPRERPKEAFLFRLQDTEHPIAINPLAVEPGRAALAVDELVEILQRVQGREYWGPQLDLSLRHAAQAAVEVGGSLIETARMLDDPWFREESLSQVTNVETARFLGRLKATQERQLLPAVNRLQRLLATPWLRNTVGQTGSGLRFDELFEQRSVALFDLSGIGTTNAKLIGSLLLLLIRQAALRRDPERAARRRHFALMDESSWFLSRTVAELLDQAREFGVGVVIAVQRLGQLAPEETRDAVLANTGTLLSFRISERDEAAFLARQMASARVGASDLQQLPRYEAYVQLTLDGDRHPPAWMRAPVPPDRTPAGAESEAALIASARARYTRPRRVVESELRDRERVHLEHDEPEIRGQAIEPVALPTNTT